MRMLMEKRASRRAASDADYNCIGREASPGVFKRELVPLSG
jgi:hypothetical protein